MYPHAIISLGELSVNLYGISIACGILACFFVLFEFGKWAGISAKYIDFAFYAGIVSIVVGFIGSAAWQGLFNYIDQIKSGVTNPKFSLEDGITAIGGLGTGALTYIIICLSFQKRYPYALTKTVMVAPLCMIIAHAFGRLGCLFGGCCHGAYLGSEYVFGGIKMTSAGTGITGYYVPVQLYESLFLFMLFAILSILVLKKRFKLILPIYLASYGVWRFCIEFARDDYRGSFIGNLSPSQSLSILLVVLAVPAFFILRHFVKKAEAHDNAVIDQAEKLSADKEPEQATADESK
ncbi:MAG: prolipoprotein diacylglyceryl transferase [Clostridia bacterium]|nr:prolipoprotein diacylglyceryl transferase [Clostridia bacterium]